MNAVPNSHRLVQYPDKPPTDPPKSSFPPAPIDHTRLSFFDLPLGVRRKIYRYAVVPRRIFVRPFVTTKAIRKFNRLNVYGTPNMALFEVCKKIYEESTPIFYGENVFSIVHVDLLMGLVYDYPRLRENLQYIRKVELVFDGRDYEYMTDAFSSQLRETAESLAKHRNPPKALVQTMSMILQIRNALLGLDKRPMANEPYRPTHERDIHDNSVIQLCEHLWARTLTFVHQRLCLTDLYIDVTNCYCPAGCCRLAKYVMNWGWLYLWVYGPPVYVHTHGATLMELEDILRCVYKRNSSVMSIDRLVDVRKVVHPSTYSIHYVRKLLRQLCTEP